MVLVTLPDGTIVARWTYDAMNPWVWWPYFAATVLAGVWVGRALLQPAPAVAGSTQLVGGNGG
jgi:alpha-1,6-mannosyltransferase